MYFSIRNFIFFCEESHPAHIPLHNFQTNIISHSYCKSVHNAFEVTNLKLHIYMLCQTVAAIIEYVKVCCSDSLLIFSSLYLMFILIYCVVIVISVIPTRKCNLFEFAWFRLWLSPALFYDNRYM